jgi:hypothetical protein
MNHDVYENTRKKVPVGWPLLRLLPAPSHGNGSTVRAIAQKWAADPAITNR